MMHPLPLIRSTTMPSHSTMTRLLLSYCCILSVSAFSPHASSKFRPKSRWNTGPPQSLYSTAANAPRNGNAFPSPIIQNQTLLEASISSSPSSLTTAVLERNDQQQEQQHGDQVRTNELEPAVQLPSQGNGKAAIVLNVNARSVTSDLTEIANNVFGGSNVFLTSTKQEAEQAAREICKQHYSLVIPVGGDGTLSTLLTLMVQEYMNQYPSLTSVDQAVSFLPQVGYVARGTGNGVGSVVGCQVKSKISLFRRLAPFGRKKRKQQALQDLFQQFKRVAAGTMSSDDYDVVELPMMQVTMDDGKDGSDTGTATSSPLSSSSNNKFDLCFFAGVGFDSLMLNDFKDIKTWSKQTGILTSVLSSVTGYCVALVVKTLPKCVLHGKHNIHVDVSTQSPDETTWIDHRRGDVMRRIQVPTSDDNDTTTALYSGETGILAAGTCPFYGGNLRLFPFARMTLDKMHLRLGRIHPLTGFVNIPKIFQGSYRDTSESNFGCIDFVGSEFDVTVTSNSEEGGFPFQHSGESVGHVEKFQLSVVKQPVKFVSFMKRRWD